MFLGLQYCFLQAHIRNRYSVSTKPLTCQFWRCTSPEPDAFLFCVCELLFVCFKAHIFYHPDKREFHQKEAEERTDECSTQ